MKEAVMIKVLILEDEILVRIGIKTTIPWNLNGYELMGEASSGYEALKLCKKEKPDIVLVDIEMPEMDGLQFISNCKKICPKTKYIVLTCHDEYDYMKQAMKFGIKNYILKSTIKKNELFEVLNKVSGEIATDNKVREAVQSIEQESIANRNDRRNQILSKIISGENISEKYAREIIVKYGLDCLTENIGLAVMTVVGLENVLIRYRSIDEDQLFFRIENIVQEIIEKTLKGTIFEYLGNRFIIIMSGTKNKLEQNCNKILERIVNQLEIYLNIKTVIGVGTIIHQLRDIKKSYEMALQAMNRSFYYPQKKVIFINEIKFDKQTEWKINDLKKSLLKYLNEKHLDLIKPCCMEILNFIKDKECVRPEKVKTLCKEIIELVNYYLSCKENIGKYDDSKMLIKYEEIEKCSSMAELYTIVTAEIDYITNTFMEETKLSDLYIINKMYEYIDKNIGMDTRLKSIAKYIGYSDNYLSRYFKRVTGENYKSYLDKRRMEIAKNMILEDRIAEDISRELGFQNISSFSRYFKEKTGLTFREYRNKLKSKERYC